ncbi:hypothetical protein ACA910_004710 [Epithemia clementina (nom. ined.)]
MTTSNSNSNSNSNAKHMSKSLFHVRLSWLGLLVSVLLAVVGPYQVSRRWGGQLLPLHTNKDAATAATTSTTTTARTTRSGSSKNANSQEVTGTSQLVEDNDDGGDDSKTNKGDLNDPNGTFPNHDFPLPILHKGKAPPLARYTEKCFDDNNKDNHDDVQSGVFDGDKVRKYENNNNEKSNPSSPASASSLTYQRWSRIDVHLALNNSSLLDSDTTSCNSTSTTLESDDDEEEAEEEEKEYHHKGGPFEPAGQHLMMDVQHVDPLFLLDMKRLAQAMVQLITLSRLTLLSYHCHDLPPPSMLGVSCVGVLLESHVSLHTWPRAGILTMDLFTFGSQSLLPLLPILKDLFAIPVQTSISSTNVESLAAVVAPSVRWTHKMRGYRDYFHAQNATLVANAEEARLLRLDHNRRGDADDAERYFLGRSGDNTKPILSAETDFQQVDVYVSYLPMPSLDDGINIKQQEQKREQEQPLATVELVNKRVFLDGALQSTLHGMEAYHEALVHPAMTMAEAVGQVRRVAIIGGGEGATLREVLKYKSVETCVMIEIDQEFVNLARKYLPEWNDCRDLTTMLQNQNKTAVDVKTKSEYVSCFEDPRAELYFDNALTWFIERFGSVEGEKKSASLTEEKKFDVIIVDALDPSSSIEFSDDLYTDKAFVSSLANALTENGVMVVQVGSNPIRADLLMPQNSKAPILVRFEDILEQQGIFSIKTYSDAHGQFMAPWEFRIVHKDYKTTASFFREPAKIDLTMAKHAVITKSKQFPFHYFDGPTWASMQYPTRINADVFCDSHPRRTSLCFEPQGYDPERANVPASALEIKPSLIPNGGRGLFFKEDFKEGSYLAIEQSSWNMQIMPETLSLVDEQMLKSEARDMYEHFHYFFFGYGYANEYYGLPSYHVDAGLAVFINHGCNGTYVVGVRTETTELTADPDKIPDELWNHEGEFSFFDPTLDRRQFVYTNLEVLLQDVKSGDEVVSNYLEYLHEDNWASGIADFKAQCLMQSIGAINRYEGS